MHWHPLVSIDNRFHIYSTSSCEHPRLTVAAAAVVRAPLDPPLGRVVPAARARDCDNVDGESNTGTRFKRAGLSVAVAAMGFAAWI